MNPRKGLRFFFLIIAIGVAGLIIFSLKDPVAKRLVQQKMPALLAGLEARIDKVHFFEKIPGKFEWELWADKAQILEKETLTILKDLRLRLVSEDRRSMEVKANKGELENASKNIEISDGVEISSDNGYTLLTDKLFWNVERQEISTQTKILLKGPNLTLWGDELVGFIHSQIIELKHVNAILNLEGYDKLD